MSLNKINQQRLIAIAKRSIENGLTTGRPLSIELADFPEELTEHRASFVTLQKNHELRGCIGMLEAVRPLVQDIAENAFSAAFRDPRFPPLSKAEFKDIEIHLSLLTAPERILFKSEQDLINQIQPALDGLILEENYHRGTFLPSVWEQLPDPKTFVQHLKQKAGLPTDYWSDSIKVYRYLTEVII